MHRVSAHTSAEDERELLASIVHHVGPVVVLEPDARVMRGNRAAERLIGLEASEAIRRAFALATTEGRHERTLEWFDTGDGRRLIGWRAAACTAEDGRLRHVVVEGIDLTEAHEAREEGEAPPHVAIAAHREPDTWHFSVVDNGIGIDPRNRDRVFEMFQRLHTRDAYPGTGVGLAIARKIVERHGGTIWVEPGAERGTVFHFTVHDHAGAP